MMFKFKKICAVAVRGSGGAAVVAAGGAERPGTGYLPSTSLHFTSLHFFEALAGQRTQAALSDSYTGP